MKKKQEKQFGKIVGGVILIAIAIWLFMTSITLADGKVLGGAILAILGIASIIKGVMGLKGK